MDPIVYFEIKPVAVLMMRRSEAVSLGGKMRATACSSPHPPPPLPLHRHLLLLYVSIKNADNPIHTIQPSSISRRKQAPLQLPAPPPFWQTANRYA
jgi:hypothetical protein